MAVASAVQQVLVAQVAEGLAVLLRVGHLEAQILVVVAVAEMLVLAAVMAAVVRVATVRALQVKTLAVAQVLRLRCQ